VVELNEDVRKIGESTEDADSFGAVEQSDQVVDTDVRIQ